MNGLIWFIVIFFLVLLVAGLFILTFLYGRRTVKNNPSKAIVLVGAGKEVLGYKGSMIEKPSSKGYWYKYANNLIIVPTRFKERYYKNKRLLFLGRKGQIIASPFENDVPLSDIEKNDLIYELIESHIGADAMKALKGKPSINLIVIGVIAFILGIGITFGYNYISDNYMQQPATATSTQTIPAETTLPDVKILPVEDK